MNCKKIHDILISDYIDDEIEPTLKNSVEKHLASCKACQDFKNEILTNTIDPFRQANKITVPEVIWENIKSSIIQEKENKQVPAFSLKEKLDYFFGSRKPVLALTSALTVIVIAIGIIKSPQRNQPGVNDYIDDQITNYCILEPNGDMEDCAEFGTLIEEYFL